MGRFPPLSWSSPLNCELVMLKSCEGEQFHILLLLLSFAEGEAGMGAGQLTVCRNWASRGGFCLISAFFYFQMSGDFGGDAVLR